MRRLAPFLLLLACLTGGCGSVTGQDRPGTSETLLLDSAPDAIHAGIYLALDRGYDEAEGVHLTLRKPGRSTDAVKQLETGRVGMAFLDIDDLARARERGADILGVMALVQRPVDSDRGAPDSPALVLAVTRATLEDSRPAVRATIRALQRGYGEAEVDPESAVAAMLSAEPDLRQDELAAQLDAVSPAVERPPGGQAFDTSLVGRSVR